MSIDIDTSGDHWELRNLKCARCSHAWRGVYNAKPISLSNREPCPFCGSLLGPHPIQSAGPLPPAIAGVPVGDLASIALGIDDDD